MTSQESFKKRIRARMARTGERYGAARRALLERAAPAPTSSAWVAQPEHSEETIQRETGRSWNEWVSAIDAGPGRGAGHTAIATWVRDDQQIDAWWAQGVTVGYERITGLRLPGQMPDGTFTISRSRTLDLDLEAFRAALWDESDRAELFPGFTVTARSRPGTKAPRFALADGEDGRALGVLQVSMDPVKDRTRIVMTHEKLPSLEAGETWQGFWAEWLTALAEASEQGS